MAVSISKRNRVVIVVVFLCVSPVSFHSNKFILKQLIPSRALKDSLAPNIGSGQRTQYPASLTHAGNVTASATPSAQSFPAGDLWHPRQHIYTLTRHAWVSVFDREALCILKRESELDRPVLFVSEAYFFGSDTVRAFVKMVKMLVLFSLLVASAVSAPQGEIS